MNTVKQPAGIQRWLGLLGPEYVERSLAMVCVGTLRSERFRSETGVRLGPMLVERLSAVVFFWIIACRPR